MNARFLTAAVIASVALVAAAQVPVDRAAVVVRFHHLHYRSDDPGALLGPTATRLNGTRTIVSGLGVGVRAGKEYVLFDRETSDGRTPGPQLTPVDAYARGTRWLIDRGLRVQPGSLADTAVGVDIPGATFDHVAFAADDLAVAIAAVKQTPVSANDDAARFRLPTGQIVEIVRDMDRPDAFWCPMHPDVRLPVEGKCSRCGMALVPIAARRIGEYRLDVTPRAKAGGGVSGFRLAVRDPASNDLVQNFADVHERLFHLFIVSRDLTSFAHVHPDRQADGSFELRHDLAPGEYVLLADFVPLGGTPQLVHRAIVTPGYDGALFGEAPQLVPGPVEQTVDGLRIAIDAPSPKPRRETIVRFTVSDARSGAAVSDLEPFLGAAGHLLIVSEDATSALHAHPEGAATSGPVVAFGPVFPAPGRYKLWVQVQRRGQVITAPFVIVVP